MLMTTNAKPKRPDFVLCIPIVILVGIGMVMVYSSSSIQSQELYGDRGVIFYKQMVALVLGSFLLVANMFIPHRIYRSRPILFLALLGAVTLLVGVQFEEAANGARRWYYIGQFGFQPSDLAKLVLVMFVSGFATAHWPDHRLWSRRLLFIVPVLVLFSALVLMQPDFGTTMIMILIVGIMLFLAGLPLKHLVLGALLLLPMVVGMVFSKSYRVKRIADYFFTEHYQTTQAKLAIGSGGLTGVGLARGKQKLFYLPEPHTDFIFATLGEEFGFLGTVTVLACYLFFLWRGAWVLRRVEAPHSKLLGSGLLLLITVQALINISIALALFPNKGLTLPFLSAGGTSLIMCLGMCGMLLNISRGQVIENRVAV